MNDFFVQYNIYEKEKSDLEKLTKNFLEKSLGDFVATETKSQEKFVKIHQLYLKI